MGKRLLLLTIEFLLLASIACGQNVWTLVDGPWYASLPRDISIGYSSGLPVMYVADSTESSLLKSTDEGETWIHLPVANPTSVACVENDPNIVYAGVVLYEPVQRKEIWKSTDGGNTWSVSLSMGGIPVKLAISPHDPNLVYLGVASFLSGDALFHSEWRTKLDRSNFSGLPQ